MKLLQWNIRYIDSLENVARIAAEIKRFDADVVCFQEVCYKDSVDNLNPLFELYPHFYFCVADSFPNKYTQGNAILSRYPIISRRDIFIQKSGDNTKFDDEGRVYIERPALIQTAAFLRSARRTVHTPTDSRKLPQRIRK